MLKKIAIERFARKWVLPRLPGYAIYEKEAILKVTRPFVHGIAFDRSSLGDDTYISCFADFLVERSDFNALGFGERLRRPDDRGQSWVLEPPAVVVERIFEAMRVSPYSPLNLQPTCRKVLEIGGTRDWGAFVSFGLGTCAIFENDPGLARHYFERVRNRLDGVETDASSHLLSQVDEIEARLGDLIDAQLLLRQWVEETIRIRGLSELA